MYKPNLYSLYMFRIIYEMIQFGTNNMGIYYNKYMIIALNLIQLHRT